MTGLPRRIVRFIAVLAFIVGVGLTALPQTVSAANNTGGVCKEGGNGLQDGSSFCRDVNADGANPISGPNGILTRATQILVFVTGFTSIIMMMIGGFRFVTANGDASSVSSARQTVLYAVIGIGVTLFGQTMVTFVLSKI